MAPIELLGTGLPQTYNLWKTSKCNKGKHNKASYTRRWLRPSERPKETPRHALPEFLTEIRRDGKCLCFKPECCIDFLHSGNWVTNLDNDKEKWKVYFIWCLRIFKIILITKIWIKCWLREIIIPPQYCIPA